MLRSKVATALLALIAAGTTQAQACPTCSGAGKSPCRTCAPAEAGATACTVAASCARCQGALATACVDCKSGAAELQRRRELAKQFLTERRTLLKENAIDERGVHHCRTAHFDLLFAAGRIDGCPESDPHLQMHLFAGRLEALQSRISTLLGTPPPPRVQVAIVKDERAARRLCLGLTGVEAQGLGGSSTEGQLACVLQHTTASGTDAALHRMLVHHVSLVLLAHALPRTDPALGYGWLATGLAHWLEADQAGGRCENFAILQRPQTPRLFHGGDWRTGVRELLEQDRLPPLAPLLATEADDFDFVQHTQAFALVDLMNARPGAPVTPANPQPERTPLQQLVAAMRDGKRAEAVLPALLGGDAEATFRQLVKERYPRR